MAVSSTLKSRREFKPAVDLSRDQACHLLLAAQGLTARRSSPATKADVIAAIQRMGFLQIDTISVVNRSQYFVLWSRLGDYETPWLDELLPEGAVFEGWARAACFLPIEDYPLFRRRTLDGQSRWSETTFLAPGGSPLSKYGELATAILSRINAEGALSASDFEAAERHPGGWWNWRAEKQVLEALFNAGELMIARRRGFQRVYDLRERVVPTWDDAVTPSKPEVDRALVLKAVGTLGVATPAWVRDYYHTTAAATVAQMELLADEGLILRARIEGVEERAYVHPGSVQLLDTAIEGHKGSATLLSPFDPVVCDRRRALQLFDFDYRIECYTPAPKRKYGYFTLPILWQDGLIGRLDAKAHRKDALFEVKSLYLESGVVAGDELVTGLAATLRDCAAWHRTPSVVVRQSDPPALAAELNRVLQHA